jgi:hypothetical protein
MGLNGLLEGSAEVSFGGSLTKTSYENPVSKCNPNLILLDLINLPLLLDEYRL